MFRTKDGDVETFRRRREARVLKGTWLCFGFNVMSANPVIMLDCGAEVCRDHSRLVMLVNGSTSKFAIYRPPKYFVD